MNKSFLLATSFWRVGIASLDCPDICDRGIKTIPKTQGARTVAGMVYLACSQPLVLSFVGIEFLAAAFAPGGHRNCTQQNWCLGEAKVLLSGRQVQ